MFLNPNICTVSLQLAEPTALAIQILYARAVARVNRLKMNNVVVRWTLQSMYCKLCFVSCHKDAYNGKADLEPALTMMMMMC